MLWPESSFAPRKNARFEQPQCENLESTVSQDERSFAERKTTLTLVMFRGCCSE